MKDFSATVIHDPKTLAQTWLRLVENSPSGNSLFEWGPLKGSEAEPK
jgi:hypothetical protein